MLRDFKVIALLIWF